MHLSDLTIPEISTLTTLLQRLPASTTTSHTSRISSLISALPSRSPLRRSSRLTSLLSSPLSTTKSQLCPLHAPLSPILLTALFSALALEVGPHLNTLTLHATSLSSLEQSRLASLRELHSLWLPADVYRSTFLAPPPKAWAYLSGQCPGCILSEVAGDMEVLLGLRMILLSRTSTRTSSHSHHSRRHRPAPRLTPFVTHWMAHLSTALSLSSPEFDSIISANDADANRLKATRKQFWKKKRESRRVFRQSQQEREQRRRKRVTHGGSEDHQSRTEIETDSAIEQPSIRVSAPSTNSSNPPRASVSSDSASDSAEHNPTPDTDPFTYLTSPAYLSTLSLPSTVSLHERPRTYIFPVTLTRHDNAGIGELTKKKERVLPVRPKPTNFGSVNAPQSQGQGMQGNTLTVNLSPPTYLNSNNSALPSPSLYSPTSPPLDRDSYAPPVFPHHGAYLPPDAASMAKRYQNLLSPYPLLHEKEMEEEPLIPFRPARQNSLPDSEKSLRLAHGTARTSLPDSEKELRIPETPGLPRRSSRRISPPEQLQSTDTNSSVYSNLLRRSRSTNSHTSSRLSSITSISAGSAYSASLRVAPLSVRIRSSQESKSDVRGKDEEQGVSTFTIRKGGGETDWYAPRRDGEVGRSQTMREDSGSRAKAWSRARRDLEGRSSVATDVTTWSDVYTCFEEDERR